MPRVKPLTTEQKRDRKVLDLKLWIKKQLKQNGMTRCDLAKALGVTPGRVTQLLHIPEKGEKEKTDVFSYGTLLILCDVFGVDGNEKEYLLTL